MTRKTGAKAVKARQLARAAKLIKYKQKLKGAGESLSLPKPSAETRKQKDAELRKLYLELIKEEPKEGGQAKQEQQTEEKDEARDAEEQEQEPAKQGEPDESETEEPTS